MDVVMKVIMWVFLSHGTCGIQSLHTPMSSNHFSNVKNFGEIGCTNKSTVKSHCRRKVFPGSFFADSASEVRTSVSDVRSVHFCKINSPLESIVLGDSKFVYSSFIFLRDPLVNYLLTTGFKKYG